MARKLHHRERRACLHGRHIVKAMIILIALLTPAACTDAAAPDQQPTATVPTLTSTATPTPTATPASPTPTPAPTVRPTPVPTDISPPTPSPTATTVPEAGIGTDAVDESAVFVSVSAGGLHTCGVKTDGSVECWGEDLFGGATPPDGLFSSISAGDRHTCGVKTDGSIVCWGEDLFVDATLYPGSFTLVSAGDDYTCGVKADGSVECWGDDGYGQATPPEGAFASVSAGRLHTCGVKTDGSVECWGVDAQGQATPPEGTFTSVSAGAYHTCGVRTDGSVECWGSNEDWRGSFAGQAKPPEGSFVSVSAGSEHTCAVETGGDIVCWGSNENILDELIGQATPPAGSFASVSAGAYHTCGVRTDGSVECWGDDSHGKTRVPGQPEPDPYTARSGEGVGPFTSVSAGTHHTCGVTTAGAVECWGDNRNGEATPPDGIFASVSAGASHTCGLKTNGLVECWGADIFGTATPLGFSFASVSAGAFHTCGVTAAGAVECWGDNRDGEATPPDGIFASVSAGWSYTCGVRTDGSVECWGDDSDVYDILDHDSPPGGAFISVSAGALHTCGVKTNGIVECWGSDSDGESTPPEGTFASVDVGHQHTCGIKTGSIVCWGSNEIGLGEFVGQAKPPEGSFVSVSAGSEHTCAVETGGDIVCWGSNEHGRATPPESPGVAAPDDDHANTGRGATPVTLGETIRGALDYRGDVDFFVFEAKEGQFYQIDVDLGTLPDSVVTLYDADVRWLASNDDHGDSNASRILWKAPRTEKHHVRVDGAYSDDVGSYTLTIVAYDGADDYPDSLEEAMSIEVDEAVQGALDYHGDADFFTFKAEAGVLYRIEVTLETLPDSMATLYDADGRELESNDDQGDSRASLIHWGAPGSGNYYVKVTGYGTGSYSLTISVNADDHGDSREAATLVAVGGVVQGALDYKGDVDFFTFEAEEGKSYRIQVDVGSLSAFTTTRYGPDGESLGVSVASNAQSRFSFPHILEAKTSGSYYIEVDGSLAEATGSYTLTVAVQ